MKEQVLERSASDLRPRTMLRWLVTLLCLLAAASHASVPGSQAEGIDWTSIHEITTRGIDRFYRLDNESALRSFDSVATMAPGDPRGYFFRSMVHFSLYVLDRDHRHFDAFMAESERVITVCERLVDQNEHDATAKFYLGGIYGYRGMAWQTEGSLVKAVTEGRQGYTLLEEAVEENPHLYDAQMGFGLFRYLVAKAPRSLHWMLKLMGVTPDLDGGLRMLKAASEHGTYTRNEAQLYLAQFLFNEQRQDEAFVQLDQLCARYPENTLFLILRASWLQRTGKPEEALADALRAVERNRVHPLRYVEDLACSMLGSLYFSRNDFAASRMYYARYADSLKSPDRVWNWTWYRIAAAHELSGDRAAAKTFYARVRKSSDAMRPMDAYYFRRAQESLQHPITHAEALIIRGGNEANSKAPERALQTFREALDTAGTNVELRARALLAMMQAQYELKLYQDVIDTSKRFFSLSPERELWVLPHGYYKLGQAYARLGRISEAKTAFAMVSEFDDYDFQDQLESRVEDEVKGLSAH
jgi:tetratricopeptide (TPR) repeat protein